MSPAMMPAVIPVSQTGMVITCARRDVHPSWERIVGLKLEREPADMSARKKRSVLPVVNLGVIVERVVCIQEPNLV